MRFGGSGASNMSRKKITLSVIIIAKNEEARIGKCLDALEFADERIVVDNSSFDRTSQVATEHDAIVQFAHSTDFALLRNNAASKVRGEWILYVDADEIVTPELGRNIRHIITVWNPSCETGYEIHRKNYYLGRAWPTGEWMLRLFRRDSFKEWRGELHETPVVSGAIGRIQGDLLHDTHRTVTEMVAKTNEWSETEALLRKAIHHPPITWWRIIRVTLTGFWNSFIGQGGWRIGTVGWIESMYQGFSMFITYAKLWEKQQKKNYEK